MNNIDFKNLVMIVSHFKDKNGIDTQPMIGGGFFIDGKYIATCYHNYCPPNQSNKIYRMEINYNFRVNNSDIKYDTVDVDLSYKYQSAQYDFFTHTYINGNALTDFIILKLENNVSIGNLTFNLASNKISKYDIFHATGEMAGKGLYTSTLKYYFSQYPSPNTTNTQVLMMLGEAREGFSGSPIFNSKSEVVGIVQGGDNILREEVVQNWYFEDKITQIDLYDIKIGYNNNMHIVYGPNIQYLYENYIKSFLN